jgi:hypothetical protein
MQTIILFVDQYGLQNQQDKPTKECSEMDMNNEREPARFGQIPDVRVEKASK